MPRTYTPQQKAEALELLAATGGDIAQTQMKTGIAERTLYRWRNELWQTWRRQAPPPPSPKPLPQFADDLEAMDFLRQKIMAELLNLANNYQENLAYTTPTQRVTLMAQFLDRLITLDEHLKPYTPVEIHHRLLDSEGEEPGGRLQAERRIEEQQRTLTTLRDPGF